MTGHEYLGWELFVLLRRRVLWTMGCLACASVATAEVFPSSAIPQNGDSGVWRYNGLKRALYYVVHDVNDPFSSAEWDARVSLIRSREEDSRSFFAANSGGRFDFYYDPIVIDAGISLNEDGTRPDGWRNQVDSLAISLYGVNLNDYFLYAYDVDDTKATPGQGWGGLSSGDAVYYQNPSTKLNTHEIGHRISLGHARAITPRNDSTYHTYVWDSVAEEYQPYIPGSSPYHATPFGAPRYEYGDPFDTMGNVSNGHFSVYEKRDIDWLTDEQVPSIDVLGEGTFRIYAHDELTPVVNQDGVNGVVQGYSDQLYYGLTFDRDGEEYDPASNTFVRSSQRIYLEYRSGEDGVAFHLDRNPFDGFDDSELLDLDPEGAGSYGNRERLLEVGQGVEDIAFGLSNFTVAAGAINSTPSGVDFLQDYNPPPPSDPTSLRPNWYHFLTLGTGADANGSYIEVAVSLVTPLNGIEGDLDQNGVVDQNDIDLFQYGWLDDTSSLDVFGKYASGDLNLDGVTDLTDLRLFRQVLIVLDNGSVRADSFVASVPEPAAGLLGLVACVVAWRRPRRGL